MNDFDSLIVLVPSSHDLPSFSILLSGPVFCSFDHTFCLPLFLNHLHLTISTPKSPLPGPPSAPRELWFEVQGSALMLHWRLPQELGGRGDLLFNVVCKECGGHGESSSGGMCRRCRDEVHFDPRQRGLTESRVLVGGLRAHVPYILEVQAVNGVSELSPDPPQAAAINVSTSHEGELFSFSLRTACFSSSDPLFPMPAFQPACIRHHILNSIPSTLGCCCLQRLQTPPTIILHPAL